MRERDGEDEFGHTLLEGALPRPSPPSAPSPPLKKSPKGSS